MDASVNLQGGDHDHRASEQSAYFGFSARAGGSGERAKTMFFTNSQRETLDKVLAEKDGPGRTIVVSSAVFYSGMPADILASGVKQIDPTALVLHLLA